MWFNVLTPTGTPGAAAFARELESWMFAHYPSYATIRPEWSKGWAYTDGGAWTDAGLLEGAIPSAFTSRTANRVPVSTCCPATRPMPLAL